MEAFVARCIEHTGQHPADLPRRKSWPERTAHSIVVSHQGVWVLDVGGKVFLLVDPA